MSERFQGLLVILGDYCQQHGTPDDFASANAAIAELLAADAEYDEAEAIARQTFHDGYALQRYHLAISRRAAALKACAEVTP